MAQQDEIIRVWLAETRGQLIENYLRLGLKASGQWANSLESFQEKTATGQKLGIIGQDYTDQLENGRLPNKNQGEKALRAWVGWAGSTFLAQWVKDKGLPHNPFAVAWKIAKKGWDVPNQHNAGGLVSDVITDEWIGELGSKLINASINDIRSDILKQFKDFKK